MNTKCFPFEVKLNLQKNEFEAYASTYDKDLVGDQVVHGAFKKTIEETFKPSPNKIKVLWQHDQREIIGKPLEMYEDSKGLYVRTKVFPELEKGSEALLLLKEGVLDSLSIGYDVIKDDISDDGSTRYLKEIKLWEYSLVTFPANPSATVTGVKNAFNTILSDLSSPQITYFLQEIKEGRALSKANLTKLKQAIESLQAILEVAEGSTDKNFEPSNHSKDNEPNFETFTQLLDEMKNYSKKGVI